MIGADAHRATELLAAQDDRRKRYVQAFEFFRVGGVGIFRDGKLLFVGIIARIDADLLDVFGGFHRG